MNGLKAFKWSGWMKSEESSDLLGYTIYSGNWARRKWWKRMFWKPWIKLIEAYNDKT